MDLRRRRILAGALLGAAALFGAAWLLRLDFRAKISTDVLDLVPADERSPELMLVRELASRAEARSLFLVLTGQAGEPASSETTRRFAAALGRSPSFSQATAMDDSSWKEPLGRALYDRRMVLLFPLWLREQKEQYGKTGGSPKEFAPWLARNSADTLGRFLKRPEAIAFEDLIPADPLLLMPDLAKRAGGWLPSAGKDGGARGLVWAQISVSPLSEQGQQPVFSAITQAARECAKDDPGLSVAFTGVNRFAAASRQRIEHEVSWLNGLSVVAVLGVAAVFIRRPVRGLHLVPVILFSVLGAWVAATMAFDRLHILVFAVGSLLTGVAIDYGFYLFMQPAARPDEAYGEKVSRLMKPLLASCFTTVAGFSLLLLSELPLIRQLGLFVGAGLVCALVAALLYFSTLRNCFLETRSFQGGQALRPLVRRNLRRLLIAAWLLALPGLTFMKWKDDIRELEIPSPQIQKEDARIRALFGDKTGSVAYLTYGATPGQARDRLDFFHDWLRRNHSDSFVSLGSVIPSADEETRAIDFVRQNPNFPGLFQAELEKAGFEPAAFRPFFDAYSHFGSEGGPAALAKALTEVQARLSGPLGLLIHTAPNLCWFVTMVSQAPGEPPPPSLHTASSSQLQSLNQIFGRYRASALRLSLVGLTIVGLGVFLSYGLSDGIRIFSIPCGACLGLFGLYGWLGVPLNLFHLLGAFLGVCLTHNYSIFSVTSAYRKEPPPVSVRLSALATAASFGVLALSAIPVVRALGMTVSLMAIAALLAIEFEHFASMGKSP